MLGHLTHQSPGSLAKWRLLCWQMRSEYCSHSSWRVKSFATARLPSFDDTRHWDQTLIALLTWFEMLHDEAWGCCFFLRASWTREVPVAQDP